MTSRQAWHAVGSPHLTRQFQGKTQLTVEPFPQKQALQARRPLPVRGHYHHKLIHTGQPVHHVFSMRNCSVGQVVSTSCSICLTASFMAASASSSDGYATGTSPPETRGSDDVFHSNLPVAVGSRRFCCRFIRARCSIRCRADSSESGRSRRYIQMIRFSGTSLTLRLTGGDGDFCNRSKLTITGYNGMLTLPAATPFTVMVIPLTARWLLFYPQTPHGSSCRLRPRLECHGQRSALPFHYGSTGGVTVMPVVAVTVLRSSAIDGLPRW